MKDNHQKIKLLRLTELLRQHTDEQHPMPTAEICRRLQEMHISCDRRTLKRDIDLLNEQGYEVMPARIGHERAYYVDDRAFSLPELKILVDAVESAAFITPNKTEQLREKIADLGGSHRAELLQRERLYINDRKHSNETIYYAVDCIAEAILLKRRISFYYFDLDENRDRVYRKEKRLYVTDPLTLINARENYYLIAYTEKHDNLTTYRLDRMDSVKLEAEDICEAALKRELDAAAYMSEVFEMFDGKEEEVTLKFHESAIGAVFDKFGEDVEIRRVDQQHCTLTKTMRVSPTFYSWLFRFGAKMRVTSPQNVIEGYRERCLEVLGTMGE